MSDPDPTGSDRDPDPTGSDRAGDPTDGSVPPHRAPVLLTAPAARWVLIVAGLIGAAVWGWAVWDRVPWAQ